MKGRKTVHYAAMLASVSALLLAAAPPTAWALSNAEQQCADAGGTPSKEQGTVTCIFTEEENVGNSPNSATVTTTTTNTSQGNLTNKQQSETDCSGPGSSTSSAHCN